MPLGIILEQVPVLFHDRAATRGVDRNELGARPLERRDVAARQIARGIEIAGVRMESSTALLAGRANDAITVDGENPAGRAIGLTEQAVHDAAAQRRNRSSLAARDRIVG